MSANQTQIEPERLIELIVDAVLNQSAATPGLAPAILNCSVPRWFDLEVVSDICPAGDEHTLAPSEIFEKLKALPFCEPHSTRASTHILNKEFRSSLLKRKEIKDQWVNLQRRAAASFERRFKAKCLKDEQRFKDPDLKDFAVEWVYHLQHLDPSSAVTVVRQICAETLAVWTSGHAFPEVNFCLEFLGSLDWPNVPEHIEQDLNSLRAGINGLLINDDAKALKTLNELVKETSITDDQKAALSDWMGQIYLWNNGRLAPALEQFQVAEQLTPNDAVILSHIAEVYYTPGPSWGRFDLAEQYARRALELSPGKPYPALALAKVAELQEEYKEATKWNQKAIEVDPQTYSGYLAQSEVYAASGEWHRALEMIDKAIEVRPDIKYDGLVRKGNVYRDAGRFSETFAEYRQAKREAPDRIDAYIASGDAYAKLWRTTEAEGEYRKAIELKPEVADGYLGLTRLSDQQERTEQIIATCVQAQDKGIEAKDIYFALLNAYRAQDRVKDFQRVQKQLIHLDPAEEYAAHCSIGDLWLAKVRPGQERGKEQWLEKAQKEYKKAVAIDSKRAWAYMAMAELAVKQNDPDKVQQQRQLVIEQTPWAHYDLLVSLGREYLKNFRYAEAKTIILSATELKPYRAPAWRALSDLHYRLGNPVGVEQAWTKLININPTLAYDAHISAGDAHKQIKNYTRAREEYTRAQELETDRYDAYWELGDIAEERADLAEAINQYQLIENKAPGLAARARMRIAAIHRYQQKYGDAEKSARTAILLDDHEIDAYLELARLGVVQRKKKLIDEARQRLTSVSADKVYELEAAVADEYWNAEDYKKAERAYKECIKLDSEKSTGLAGLARVRLSQERLGDAKKYVSRALELDTTDVNALGVLSQVYELEQDMQGFIKTQNRLIEINPTEQYNAHLAIGGMYEKLNQLEDAEERFRAAIELSPWRIDGYAALGSLLRKLSRSEEAKRTYEEARDITGIHYLDLGGYYERQGKLDDAFEVYSLGLKHEEAEYKPALHSALGSLQVHLKDFKLAEEGYRQAISLDPKGRAAYIDLADLLADENRFDDAIEVCREMAKQPELAYSAHLSIGNLLIAQQKYEEAAQSYQQALQTNPQRVEAYLKLAVLYNQQNQADKAEPLLLQAAEVAPENPEPHWLLAELREQQQQWDEAIKLYRRIVELQPDGEDASGAHVQIGSILLQNKRYKEAETELQQAVDCDPGNVQAYYDLGLAYERQEKMDQAIESYRQVVELTPSGEETSKVQVIIGNLLILQNRYDEAERELQQAIESDPNNEEAYYKLATVYQGQDKLKQAIKNYTKATELAPTDLDAYFGLGRIYAAEKDVKSIARLARRILGLKLPPEGKYDAYLLLADIYKAAGDSPQAATTYREAIQFDPTSRAAYINLAQLFADEDRLDEALEVCREMAKQPELAYLAHLSIGNLLIAQQKYEEAAQSYQQALELEPKTIHAYLKLADLHNQQNQPEKAESLLLQATEVAPEDPESHRLLAELKEEQQQWDEAIKLYRRTLELQPEGEEASNAHLRIGSILLQQQRYDEAEKEFQQVVDSDPGNAQAYYNLGVTHEQQGELERAAESYTKTTEIIPKHGDAYRALGRIFAKQGDTKSLAQMARHILEMDLQPAERYDAYLLIANAYQEAALYEWAIDNLNKAVLLDPMRVDAYGSLGLIYEVQQRWSRAREAYEKIGELVPEVQSDVHLRLSQLFIVEENAEEAEKELTKTNTKELEPSDVIFELITSSYLNIASLYRKQGKLEAMKRMCAEIISLTKSVDSPNNDTLRHQGLADLMQGNYQEGVQSFRKALTKAPADSKARLYLALALLPLGEKTEAQSELKEAIKQAKYEDDYRYAIEEATVLSTKSPEVPGAKEMLEALREASDKAASTVAVTA